VRDVLPQLMEMCAGWDGGDTIGAGAGAVAGGVIADA
jgi:hypothetical protein